MKRFTHIVLLSLLIISGNVNAQFAKPLPNKQDPWAEAQYSIGVIGGISATHWIHLGGTNTDYEQPITTIAFDSTFLLLPSTMRWQVFPFKKSLAITMPLVWK